jgi:ribose transport system substrate-binding protein
MMKKVSTLFLCMLLVLAVGLASVSINAASKPLKVFLITMDQMDQYWAGIDQGCKRAAAELGNVDYKWTAPDVKDDAKQIEMINNAVANGANAILLAANGPDAVTAALKEAQAKKVQIVYVDSPAKFPAVATYATNNEGAGKTAGNEMLKNLAEAGIKKGKIGIISVNAATASTVAREKGFRAALQGKGYTLLATQYCDGDAARAKDIATNYITQGCIGIFGANEGSAVGTGNAIRESGQSVIGIGFDSSDAIKSLLKNGFLKATMVQNPSVMGYEGLKKAVGVLKGTDKADGKVVDTGVSVVTE